MNALELAKNLQHIVIGSMQVFAQMQNAYDNLNQTGLT